MKIAVLLSGGVDSSVALNLLKEQGYTDITAFYLKIWLEDELAHLGDCPWETDLKYAQEVCEQAEVPLEIIPLQNEYRKSIVEYSIAELKAGRTPSPDILCNQKIKFGEFINQLNGRFEKIASGHYAQIKSDNGKYQLLCSPDPIKDQTYFLSRLAQDQLSKILFPIGHMHKGEVRNWALKNNLPTKDRRDSQGICFLGKIKYADFVKFHLGEQPGELIDLESGEKVGDHRGFWFFTIGQRQGLGLSGGPWFVIKKDVEKNIVYISHSELLEQRSRNQFNVHDVHWIGEEETSGELQVKLRHTDEIGNCILQPLKDGKYLVTLEEKDSGIAPGQSAIFYRNNVCLGGGLIE